MRLSNAFFYAVVFMAVTLMLYFILDLSSTSVTGQRKQLAVAQGTPEEIQAIDDLEKKLSNLETSIKRNREIVVSLQGSLKSMLKYEVPLLQDKLLTEEKDGEISQKEQTPAPLAIARQKANIIDETSSHVPDFSETFSVTKDATSTCPAETWVQSRSDIKVWSSFYFHQTQHAHDVTPCIFSCFW